MLFLLKIPLANKQIFIYSKFVIKHEKQLSWNICVFAISV